MPSTTLEVVRLGSKRTVHHRRVLESREAVPLFWSRASLLGGPGILQVAQMWSFSSHRGTFGRRNRGVDFYIPPLTVAVCSS